MPTSPGTCNCSQQCPGHPNCTCLHIIGPPTKCSCDCPDGGAPPIAVTDLVFLKAEDRVGIDVHGKELGAVAEFIHRVTEADILIPVSQLRSPVTMHLEDVTFAEALQALGLGLRSSPESAY